MVREDVKKLTYIQSAQDLYCTRGRVTNAGKFLQEVGQRCSGWNVDVSVVYALMKAYLDFESVGPVSRRMHISRAREY